MIEPGQPKKENFLREIIKASLIALIVVIPIRFFIAQPFIVSGASMDPAFESGHYLIVDQLSYRFDEPKRGDVIIFRYPEDPSKFFIKRIIALPEETIITQSGEVTIVSGERPEGFPLNEPYVAEQNQTNESFKDSINDDEYFVMGDNRRASSDSRIWGPLKKDFIIGRAFMRLLPLSQVEFFPGKAAE